MMKSEKVIINKILKNKSKLYRKMHHVVNNATSDRIIIENLKFVFIELDKHYQILNILSMGLELTEHQLKSIDRY